MTSLHQAFEHVDRFAQLWRTSLNIPGLALVVTDREKTLASFTYGYADIATQSAVTPDTRFEIGSLGKPFTVIVLMQLREEGRLALDAPVSPF